MFHVLLLPPYFFFSTAIYTNACREGGRPPPSLSRPFSLLHCVCRCQTPPSGPANQQPTLRPPAPTDSPARCRDQRPTAGQKPPENTHTTLFTSAVFCHFRPTPATKSTSETSIGFLSLLRTQPYFFQALKRPETKSQKISLSTFSL